MNKLNYYIPNKMESLYSYKEIYFKNKKQNKTVCIISFKQVSLISILGGLISI